MHRERLFNNYSKYIYIVYTEGKVLLFLLSLNVMVSINRICGFISTNSYLLFC